MKSVIISYKNLKDLALEGIPVYQDKNKEISFEGGFWGKTKATVSFAGKIILGNQEGFWHGTAGINRAIEVKKMLNNAQDDKEILAILLAIFDDPDAGILGGLFGFHPGRSSALAYEIAEKLITGQYEIRAGSEFITGAEELGPNRLESEAFNMEIPQKDIFGVDIKGRETSVYYDKVKGARDFLKQALEKDFQVNDKQIILSRAQSIREELKKETVKANVSDKTTYVPSISKDTKIKVKTNQPTPKRTVDSSSYASSADFIDKSAASHSPSKEKTHNSNNNFSLGSTVISLGRSAVSLFGSLLTKNHQKRMQEDSVNSTSIELEEFKELKIQ